MEDWVKSSITSEIRLLLTHLDRVYDKNSQEMLEILDTKKNVWPSELLSIPKAKQYNKRPQCCARVWNNGKGGRCSMPSTNGSEFCLKHCLIKFPTLCQGCVNFYKENRYHNYVWEHLGRYDDPLPEFFLKKKKHKCTPKV